MYSNKRIVYTDVDSGNVCVVFPAPGAVRIASILGRPKGGAAGEYLVLWAPERGAAPAPLWGLRALMGRLEATHDGVKASPAETAAQFLARVRAKSVPAGARDVIICDAADLPADLEYRDAWRRDKTAAPNIVAVDLTRAKAIDMHKLRVARDGALQALDGPWMRAHAGGNTVEAERIEAERRALRDLPAAFEAASPASPSELRALWPAELVKPGDG